MLTKPYKFMLFMVLSLATVGLVPNSARAATDITTFTSDVNALILQGNTLVTTVNTTALTGLTMSTSLASLAGSINSYLQSVQAVYDSLAGSATMSLTNDSLLALQSLSGVVTSLGTGVLSLSSQVVSLAALTSLSALQSSLASMLQLSSDIGAMADRIGEMADRILLMADNIGTMADRILATQLIQSANLKLIVDAVLETQKNMLILFGAYNL